MLPTKFKYEKKKQRAITPKLGKGELWFLYTTLFRIEIYITMKFGVDTLKLTYLSCEFAFRVRPNVLYVR